MREDKIYKLKILILDYEREKETLSEMVQSWKEGDPMSDPGLQYEQELEVDKAYKAIIDYVKTSM